MRFEVLKTPMSEEFVNEEGFLLEGSHLPIVADEAHRPHSSLEPDVEVLLLPSLSVLEAESPERENAADLLVILLDLMRQKGKMLDFSPFDDFIQGPRYNFETKERFLTV